jgi:hypothetical protein
MFISNGKTAMVRGLRRAFTVEIETLLFVD